MRTMSGAEPAPGFAMEAGAPGVDFARQAKIARDDASPIAIRAREVKRGGVERARVMLTGGSWKAESTGRNGNHPACRDRPKAIPANRVEETRIRSSAGLRSGR